MAHLFVTCSYQLAQRQLQMDGPEPVAEAPLFWVHARSARSTLARPLRAFSSYEKGTYALMNVHTALLQQQPGRL